MEELFHFGVQPDEDIFRAVTNQRSHRKVRQDLSVADIPGHVPTKD